MGRLRTEILFDQMDKSKPFFTRNGSFWTGNFDASFKPFFKTAEQMKDLKNSRMTSYASVSLIPLSDGDQNIGILELSSRNADYFTEEHIRIYENVGHILGISIMSRRAQEALGERVKELTCLYKISHLMENENMSIGDILQAIAGFIPPAWQYPEITHAKIILDGRVFSNSSLQKIREKQIANVIVKGEYRGQIEVAYTKMKPTLDEGPFLKEERNLIQVIANQIAQIVERKEAEQEKSALHEQIRHADRLATIGQLAAGVAHELNEPLTNILGFAQLIKKFPALPDQVDLDIGKIVSASLHAREVIKKLMIFARQMPPKKAYLNLNEVVEEGLYFLEARCAKAGIELSRLLTPELPKIFGDHSQLNQVLINLVVNSLQAMPDGGTLTIRTKADRISVTLEVEDTGIGMNQEVIKKIFLPFYTTKDVNEGTGLGLAVVHGIVTSHLGSIQVESSVGRGSKFIIHLPVSVPTEKEGKI